METMEPLSNSLTPNKKSQVETKFPSVIEVVTGGVSLTAGIEAIAPVHCNGLKPIGKPDLEPELKSHAAHRKSQSANLLDLSMSLRASIPDG